MGSAAETIRSQSARAPRRGDRDRYWRALRAAALAAAPAVLVLAFGAFSAQREERVGSPAQAKREANEVARLSVPAKATVSRVLGRDDGAYRAVAAPGGFRAQNAPHGLTARFTSAGVEVGAGGARFGLTLRALGYGEAQRPVARAAPMADANRVAYRRGPLIEWYVNGPLGLEQGFTLAAPPASEAHGPLTLALALTGTLRAKLDAAADGLSLEGSALRYRGLFAVDARGRELPARLELRGRTLLVQVDDAGARYPVTIDPFIQQAKLTASDGEAGDVLGIPVAVSGDTIVAGANGDDTGGNVNQGAVYVFQKPAAGWASGTETAKLTASDGATGDGLGFGVDISGDTIAAGASGAAGNQGAVYVFEKPPAGWASGTETAKLTASGGAMPDGLGLGITVSGDTIVAGAPLEDVGGNADQGSVYVFERPLTGWASGTETAKLTASDGAAQDHLGFSVAISGDTLVAGANGDDAARGSAYVFAKPAAGWASVPETAKLTASDRAMFDRFGNSVALSGDTVVAGANEDDIGANPDQGSVYVFEKPAAGWASGTETAKLTASEGQAGDFLGFSVAISGDTVVAGARLDDIGGNANQGSAYVFEKPAAGWASGTEAEKLTASDGAATDIFGASVAISGDTLVVAAPLDDVGGNEDQGSAYVFVAPPPPPARVAQHFKGYEVGSEVPVFAGEDIVLEDQFVRETVHRGPPRLLLTPVEKRRAGRPPTPIERPQEHLKCYRITGGARQDRFVRVSNQFVEDRELLVKDPNRLCAPATKALEGPPSEPPADSQHYKCYRVEERPPLPEETVDLVDQFGIEHVVVRRAELLCNPVTKERANGERVVPPRPEEHLVCYGIRELEVFEPRTVFTLDQFGSQRLRVLDALVLCVPSEKVEVPTA